MAKKENQNTVEIFLDKQTRRRIYREYEKELCLNETKYYSADKSVLVIGGGTGVYKFPYKIDCNIVNIDLKTHPELIERSSHKIELIQRDFIKTKFAADSFDEIWAFNSLPLYCASVHAVQMFFMKSILCLKPGGVLRISPAIPNHVINEGLMNKDTSNISIFRAFYECSEQFTKMGGQVQFFWSKKISETGCMLEESEILEKTKRTKGLSELKFKNYAGLRHQVQESCSYTTAIFSKPIAVADDINDKVRKSINKLKKNMLYPEIIVYTQNDKTRY